MERIRSDILRAELAGGGRLLQRRREFNRQLRLRGSGRPRRSPSRQAALTLVVKWPSLEEGEQTPQYDREYLGSVGWKQKKLAPPRSTSLERHVLRGDRSTERLVRAHIRSAWKGTRFKGARRKEAINMYAMTDTQRSKCRACGKKYEKYGHTKARPTPACRRCVRALCACVGTNKKSGRCVQFRCASGV